MQRIGLLLLCCCLLPSEALRRRCINSGVLFPDKILRSPIVVYGEATAKQVYLESDTELLFNVTFRVDCIFKGQDVEHRIDVTQAGIKTGHTACQWLEPGNFYVVFLEKWGMNSNGYRPLDFQERMVDNMTFELLEKTCHLTRLPPLHSTTDNCPNVSMTEACPHDEIDVNIMPKQKYSDNTYTDTRPSYFNNANQFYLQSNVSMPKDAFSDTRKGDRLSSAACSVPVSSLWLMAFLSLVLIEHSLAVFVHRMKV